MSSAAEMRSFLFYLGSKIRLLCSYLNLIIILASMSWILGAVSNTSISHLNLSNKMCLQSLFCSKESPSPFYVVSAELQIIMVALASIIEGWYFQK